LVVHFSEPLLYPTSLLIPHLENRRLTLEKLLCEINTGERPFYDLDPLQRKPPRYLPSSTFVVAFQPGDRIIYEVRTIDIQESRYGIVKYGDKKIRPMVVLGPNLTFSTGQFPTLSAWINFKFFLQLENHNLFKPLEVEVQGIKAASIVDDCISMCESDLDFCMGPHSKRYMATNSCYVNNHFSIPL